MAFNINTNITSLQAQESLRVTTDFQSRTINRITSGLRILSSGDDAAGLAIANAFRSDRSVLAQGIRNANDGLSTLQTIDGGLNNISRLLDRARTLAAQSASGTFSGDRAVLNTEFQSVLGEIDRQAQSIGLNTSGSFARNLSVFIGGGRTSASITAIQNGSVSVDLSRATIDTRSLGLRGVQVSGALASAIDNIVADATNVASLSTEGFTDFVLRGPGFSDAGQVRLSVSLAGVTDATTIAANINSAIDAAASTGTATATALENAGIRASVVTDADGQQRIAFSSSTAAFQVAAGDLLSNALLGNEAVAGSPTGATLNTTVTGAASSSAGATTFGAAGAGTVVFRLQGAALSAPVDISLTVAAGTTVTEAIDDLSTQVSNNASLKAAGITLTGATAGSALVFTSSKGERFDVQVTGDTRNLLGFGSFLAGASSAFDYATFTTGADYATTAAGTATVEISINGAASSTNALTVNLAQGDATAATATGTDTAATVDTSGAGDNILRLAVNGTVYNITLTANAATTKGTIADEITTALGAAGSATVVGNAIQISTAATGAGNTIQILDGGANAVLGFTEGDITRGAARSQQSVVDSLNQQFALDAELQAAGLQASVAGNRITIASSNNTFFRVNARGTTAAAQVLGNIAGTYDTQAGANILTIAVDGGADQTVTLTSGAAVTAATVAAEITNQLSGASASVVGGRVLITSTSTGTSASIEIKAGTANAVLGYLVGTTTGTEANIGSGVSGATFAGNTASAAPTASSLFQAGGSAQTAALSFTPIAYGSDDQVITFTANDLTGAAQSLAITLRNDGTARSGRTLDAALSAINTALQGSSNATLQSIVAVKENDAGTERIRFLSTLPSFHVSIGSTANGTGIGSQGTSQSSTVSTGGSTADIGTQAAGESAVEVLATAVTLLGASQAVVGRGQNQFNFAVSLAQTQLNSLAASESRIRDADLAAEAAELTKAQILQQAGIAALAQANVAPQAVLSLLRA